MPEKWSVKIHRHGDNYTIRIPKKLIEDPRFPFKTRSAKTPTGRETVELARLDGYEITLGPGYLMIAPRQEQKRPLQHINVESDHLWIRDNLIGREVFVYMRLVEGRVILWCDLDQTDSCIHVGFAYTVPKLVKELRKRGLKYTDSGI